MNLKEVAGLEAAFCEWAINQEIEIPMPDVLIVSGKGKRLKLVGIRYDANIFDAPYVTCKYFGEDQIKRCQNFYKKRNVPIVVTARALGTTLFKCADIGQEIPKELNKAVAEVLATVYNNIPCIGF